MGGGIRVFESPYAVTYAAARELKPKDWHARRGYAKRIAKKWKKRYGEVAKPAAFLLPGEYAYFVHPTVYAQLKLAVDRGEFPTM